jgi:hypothetical protein
MNFSEKLKKILKKIGHGVLRGLAACSVVFAILFSVKAYFKSDMYSNSKKEYILENIDKFEIKNMQDIDLYICKMYIEEDGYYDEVSIVLNNSRSYAVFWANRDKIKESNWQNLCWFLIKDTTFDLNEEEIDSAIITEMKKKLIQNGN